MIQLSYDTAYDPYHTAFRMMRACVYAEGKFFHKQTLRILDFYINFPHLLESYLHDSISKLPRGGKDKIKKIGLESYPRPYGDLPESAMIFRQMENIQAAALQTLCFRGMLDSPSFKNDLIKIVPDKIPADLIAAIRLKNEEQSLLMDFLVNFLASIELYGPTGLKARTRLLEYRYDSI